MQQTLPYSHKINTSLHPDFKTEGETLFLLSDTTLNITTIFRTVYIKTLKVDLHKVLSYKNTSVRYISVFST